MGSLSNNKPSGRLMGPHHNPPCTRTHQITALALVAATFFLTRLFDQYSPAPCNHSSAAFSTDGGGGSISWPHRGYGSHLSLKIYVYDELEIDGLMPLLYGRDGNISPDSCLKGQWGTQVKIHRMLLQSRFRTRKKEEADLFFVPSYVKCVRMMGGLNDKEINQTYVKGDRTDKRDTSAFNTWKDIIIPGNVDDGMTAHSDRLVQPLPLFKRKYLANFFGRAQGKVGRLQLVELAKQYPDKLESPELKFSGPNKLGKKEYFEHLRNAKFCLAPRGESSWTLRFYESFFVECVPVIISDYAELPFQNVIDYTQISIKWPWNRIGSELLEYLESVPDRDIERMIAYGRQVRCLWVYAPELEPCSAFNGILWELQRKVRQFHQSAETFWLHNRSIVNRNLVEFSHWKPPMPLP
ncbi:hypothetical protein TEA_002566 [Camellia sinensis var. sinensis]|uniref:Exostosin GT47 domain-containing protein n=1 Tax=Camellia sinensis var. sinensis TaxID=542762 RepID=A0A4S4DGV4_CAMSN|nr:hypothetical protein TEA_002566 [Camellia sinensis var. sinensis]